MEKTVSDSISNAQYYIDLATQYGMTYAIKLVIAIFVYLIGKRVARGLTNLVVNAMRKNEVDRELTNFLESLIYWGLLAVVVIAALSQLGIQTASFIAILGAAGLAVGLALQGSLSNFAAGILILLLRPFNVDDFVEMAGTSGKVKSIRIFTTELRTGDNKCVIIPNARVLASNIINFSSTGRRRVDLVFCVSYNDDLDKVRTVIKQVVDADDRILTAEQTLIAVSQLGDSSVNFNVRPWVATDDYWGVFYDLTENIKKAFDANDISIPFPQIDINRGGADQVSSGE